MDIVDLKNFTNGWFVGDFEPSLFKTKDFEASVKIYKKGDIDPKHVHKIAREITVIVTGEFEMNGQILKPGQVVDLPAGEPSEFKCLADGAISVIKMPSVKGDKYNI